MARGLSPSYIGGEPNNDESVGEGLQTAAQAGKRSERRSMDDVVKLKPALSHPDFAKHFLRKLVESLQHVSQEKAQLQQSAMITCKAIAPRVAEWVDRQK